MNKYFLNFYEFCGQSKRFRIQKTLFFLFSFYTKHYVWFVHGYSVYKNVSIYMYDDFEYKGRIEGKKNIVHFGVV